LDLDALLTSYETSQNFNLVDLGAFFITGPLSSLAIWGYRYWNVSDHTSGGQGSITHFNSHWMIKKGVAEAADCALATRHNRIALKGKLDLVSERYDNILVALLDEKGCAMLKQSISGSFHKPHIRGVNVAESLAGPFYNLYRKAKRFVRGETCEIIYDGTVKSPHNGRSLKLVGITPQIPLKYCPSICKSHIHIPLAWPIKFAEVNSLPGSKPHFVVANNYLYR
jgi:AsmA protein